MKSSNLILLLKKSFFSFISFCFCFCCLKMYWENILITLPFASKVYINFRLNKIIQLITHTISLDVPCKIISKASYFSEFMKRLDSKSVQTE